VVHQQLGHRWLGYFQHEHEEMRLRLPEGRLHLGNRRLQLEFGITEFHPGFLTGAKSIRMTTRRVVGWLTSWNPAFSKTWRALPEQVAAQAEAVRRTTAPAPDPSPGSLTGSRSPDPEPRWAH
jgi:hypothetical protein